MESNTLRDSFTYGSSAIQSGELHKAMNIYLFGFPIRHSSAPLLHSTLFNQLAVPWSYSLLESRDKNDFLPKLKSADCIGSAVTMPHKVTFLSEVDDVTEEGRLIGAINTVFIRIDPDTGRRRYIGTNTDCIGVREAFLQNCPDIRSKSIGKPALVIGGGGACRSSVYALWKWLGASKIYLVNRLQPEVDEIIASFQSTDQPELAQCLVHVATLKQAQKLETPHLIVGAIPDLSPVSSGEILAREIILAFLEREDKGWLLEMCYHPHPITQLYVIAERHGWNVLPGTEAMIHQGIAQEVLWMERQLEDAAIQEATRVIKDAVEAASQAHHVGSKL